jgi:hypothetical protein
MRTLSFFVYGFLFGCSDPLVEECENVEMPLVSEFLPEGDVILPTKTMLLLDYSGSMHAIYPDSRSSASPIEPYFFELSGFSDVLASWLSTSTPTGDKHDFEIVLFNGKPYKFNAVNGRTSRFKNLSFPLDIGSAKESEIKSWIDAIPDVPYSSAAGIANPNNSGNTTKIKEVLETVVGSINDDVVIWLLTDNLVDKKSLGTTSAEANFNREFYDYLKTEPTIKAVLGYPLKSPSVFKDRSLMLYGIFHSKGNPSSQQIRHVMGEGASSASAKKGLIWNPALGSKSKSYSCNPATNQGKPIRLKPIDTEVLTIELDPKALEVNKVDCRSPKMGDPKVKCTATVSVTNNLNHQIVSKAEISLKQQALSPKVNGKNPSWIGDICANSLNLEYWTNANGQQIRNSTILIEELEPKQTQSVQIRFSMKNPPVSTASISEIFAVAQTPKVDFDGELFVTVGGIETRLETGKSDLSCIAKSDELPELFRKQSQSKPSTVEEAFSFKLKNSGNEQALLLLLLFGGLGGLALIVVMRFQGVGLEMLVDGRMHSEGPFKLVRISKKEFGKQKGDTPFVRISRGWGKSYKVTGVNGYIVDVNELDDAYVAYPMDDESEQTKLVIRRAFSGGDTFDSDDDDF